MCDKTRVMRLVAHVYTSKLKCQLLMFSYTYVSLVASIKKLYSYMYIYFFSKFYTKFMEFLKYNIHRYIYVCLCTSKFFSTKYKMIYKFINYNINTMQIKLGKFNALQLFNSCICSIKMFGTWITGRVRCERFVS